jgi:multidrug efflux system outer membrane protein
MRRSIVLLCMAAAFMAGCKVGPNYSRPQVPAPPQFRAGEQPPSPDSLGNVKWFDLFQDEVLRGLIKEALAANYDIRIAAQRVVQAQGQYTATRSLIYPTLNAQGVANRNGWTSPTLSTAGGFLAAAWELDFWGKYRRASEAAKADMLALEENQKLVMQTLVAQVAASYFDLREYDAELEYVIESIKTRVESVKLVTARAEGGVGSLLEVDQAKTLVAAAQAAQALLEKAREQTENLISFLTAKPPAAVARGLSLTQQPQPPQVPAGLPSALLDRRPDLRAAEQSLIAANARVGVAKAAFFPTITITAAGGGGTADLLNVINRTGMAYTMGGFVDLPIFDAGRRRGNYKTAQAQHEELLINYQRSINDAFREVSDALIGYQKSKEYTASQSLLADTLRDQSRLANIRYVGGVSSYLEVLDTERQRLTAEQDLAKAQRDVLVSLVQLYKSLGGGWQ